MSSAPARVRLAQIRSAAIGAQECLDAVADPRAGGVALFVGAVRDSDEGLAVTRLDYEAHPGALGALEAVLGEVADAAGAPDGDRAVLGVAAVHRVGTLEIGDVAVVVAASAVHREEAFLACRRLIDELKARVPIWKRQHFADGTSQWVGLP